MKFYFRTQKILQQELSIEEDGSREGQGGNQGEVLGNYIRVQNRANKMVRTLRDT